jgi:hypothetical protein
MNQGQGVNEEGKTVNGSAIRGANKSGKKPTERVFRASLSWRVRQSSHLQQLLPVIASLKLEKPLI